MCGRFTTTAPADILAEELGLVEVAAGYTPSFNVAPTQPVPVITQWSRRTLELHRWGLVPSWATDLAGGAKLINARAETLTSRPSFRDAFEKRRCLVVGDGFYEWKRRGGQRIPMYIRRRDRRPWAFAGLWEGWLSATGELVRTCTIITTEPSALLAPVHDRMPVILDRAARDAWLRDGPADLAALRALLVPGPDAELEMFSVSPLVNKPDNDVPACIEPQEPAGTLPLFPEL